MNKILLRLCLISSILLIACKDKPNNTALGNDSPQLTSNLSKEPLDSFMRLAPNAQDPKTFDVAIARYQRPDGSLFVDLIGAVHFGEVEYYSRLNSEFKKYDAVLYELIAPDGHRPNIKDGLSSIGQFQMIIADLLTLEHQLVGIDYQAKNFVHADMDFDGLAKLATERGDNKMTILAGLVKDLMQVSSKLEQSSKNKAASANMDLNATLELIGNPVKLKQLLAKSLLSGETTDILESMSTIKPYVLDGRNDQALKVLDQEIKKGSKRIAIFYGAAHLKDFEQKLFKDFGLSRSTVDWEAAWDLTKSTKAQQNEFVQLIGTISSLMRLMDQKQ